MANVNNVLTAKIAKCAAGACAVALNEMTSCDEVEIRLRDRHCFGFFEVGIGKPGNFENDLGLKSYELHSEKCCISHTMKLLLFLIRISTFSNYYEESTGKMSCNLFKLNFLICHFLSLFKFVQTN